MQLQLLYMHIVQIGGGNVKLRNLQMQKNVKILQGN